MDIVYPNPGSTSSFNTRQQQQHQQPRYPYPQLAQPVGPPYGRPPPPVPSNPPARTGIRVALKPEYRLAPPPELLPLMEDIPQSTFQFDFDLERKILEESRKEGSSFIGSLRRPSSLSRVADAAGTAAQEDPVVAKYTSMGLNKEAVVLAIATYGDVQTKVVDFVASYDVLREMGFEPDKIADGQDNAVKTSLPFLRIVIKQFEEQGQSMLESFEFGAELCWGPCPLCIASLMSVSYSFMNEKNTACSVRTRSSKDLLVLFYTKIRKSVEVGMHASMHSSCDNLGGMQCGGVGFFAPGS
ncbi:hypothetical protein GOP47_0008666 [Adiantum capillus-veneris]|uniref:Uncharacterized protein n=1 Tax=Adiantum capillus-veneris TaxID=13818 RepID=A0A9D4ZKM5_ADICA|nr:hypothetical protein GOP47_0008666 [Adiantum capillus-veneris]